MSDISSEQVDLSRHLIEKGPKFRSHTIQLSGDRAYLKPTLSALFFCLIYVAVGIFLLGLAIYVYLSSQQMDLIIFLTAAGTGIATFGITLLQPFIKRAYFDKSTGTFRNQSDRPLQLENIVSLQIVNKLISSKNGVDYPCYELNVLTKYGRRLNILNHNDLAQMEEDGKKLSEFLGVELLDKRKECP
ncbi:MAG: hypothetical protein CSB47_11050 [Proteobacteria bacterium]|nr:MAG: hypothetical protein CSB47_11050 [Pseudomonadota bacterium]